MSGRFGIRPVTRADRKRWLELRSRLWPDHPSDELAREVDAFLAGGGLWNLGTLALPFAAFVADSPESGLVGFVEASLRPFADRCRTSPVGYLEGWFVVPEFRRQGVGRALVRAAEEWARSRGCHEMASDARVDNEVSERSHRALGYDVAHRLVHFRRDLACSSGSRAEPP